MFGHRLYPDLWSARLGFIVADVMMVLWIVFWISIGMHVHDAFWTLHILADGVIATGTGVTAAGTQIDSVVNGMQGMASSVAALEDVLRNALAAMLSLISDPMEATGQTLLGIGQQLTQALEGLQQDVGSLALGVGATLSTAVDPLIALARLVTDLGTSIVSSGQDLRAKVSALQHTAATLPALRAGLAHAVSPLHAIPQTIGTLGRGTIAQGQQELVTIGNLALLMGVLVAAVPVIMALCTYLFWRINALRPSRYLDAILNQPNAAVEATALQVLAGRAIYTLPYDRLVRYTPDPIGAWHAGHYYDLARAVLAEEGFDLGRYIDRPALEAGGEWESRTGL